MQLSAISDYIIFNLLCLLQDGRNFLPFQFVFLTLDIYLTAAVITFFYL